MRWEEVTMGLMESIMTIRANFYLVFSARHSGKHVPAFPFFVSTQPDEIGAVVFPFYRRGACRSEGLSGLHRIMQLLRSELELAHRSV